MIKKIAIIALVLFTGIGFAQKSDSKKMANAVKKHEKRSPEARAEIQSKQLTLQLDLSEKQQVQVQNVLLKHYTEGKAKRDANRKSDKKLTEEQKTALKSERLDAQIALKAEMKTILNAEQYVKYSESIKRRGKKKKRRKVK